MSVRDIFRGWERRPARTLSVLDCMIVLPNVVVADGNIELDEKAKIMFHRCDFAGRKGTG